MRQFITTVVEQRKDFTDIVDTHPTEAAWAAEAIFFMTVEKVSGKEVELKVKVQISPDGVNWLDEGTAIDPVTEKGQYFMKVNHFGGWLRLLGKIKGEDAIFNLTIHLVLKE
jgi:hypothetical protein